MKRSNSRRRSGFTLIELLVIIAIIVVLTGIAVGAYFRVRISQEEKAAETTLSKVQSQLDQQWRAVLDNAKEESRLGKVPSTIISMADSDPIRTTVIWTKFRLKQEFPQTFWEAVMWPYQMRTSNIAPLESKYAADIGLPADSLPRDPATMTAAEQYLESAALLYLSLTAKGRRGENSFNPTQHLGAHAVGRVTIRITDSPPTTKEFNVFLDSWGQPICFVRWPFGAAASDLNAEPHMQRNSKGQPVDPQDPEKKLHATDWTQRDNFVQTLGHPINKALPPLNLSPVIFSLGRDQALGVLGFTSANPPALGNQTYLQIDPAAGDDESDNLYGYRVKVGRTNK